MYDLEIELVSDEIKRRCAKRVLLQMPDGLRPKAFKLLDALRERTDAEFLLLGDSCYGACDLATKWVDVLEVDLLIHYGHSRMLPDTVVPTLYVEAKVEIDVNSLVEEAMPLIGGWSKVGLATTIQHVHQLEEVAKALRLKGLSPIIGKAGGRALYDGQILGCDYSSAISVNSEAKGFLFIGGGRFHPLGLALVTKNPVVAADPYLLSTTFIGEDDLRRLAMRRMAAIIKAKKAQRFGIIVSIKPGQFDLTTAENLQNMLEEQGKKTVIICFNDVRADFLTNFSEVDTFINTACPRLALDGIGELRKPILTLEEAHVLLGERRWEEIWSRSYLK